MRLFLLNTNQCNVTEEYLVDRDSSSINKKTYETECISLSIFNFPIDNTIKIKEEFGLLHFDVI